MATRFERLCRSCYQHRALYRVRGGHVARYSPDHPLCFRCWRSLIDHERARQLAEREGVLLDGGRALTTSPGQSLAIRDVPAAGGGFGAESALSFCKRQAH